MDLLVPTQTETRCPYKGVASYYSVRTGATVVEDGAWCYRHPIPEYSKTENLVCFFNERVDALRRRRAPAPSADAVVGRAAVRDYGVDSGSGAQRCVPMRPGSGPGQPLVTAPAKRVGSWRD